MSGLISHAKHELRKAGFLDKNADYGGAMGESVIELIKVFSDQGHSGTSAIRTLSIFNKISRFKLLTPIDIPKEGDYQIVNNEKTRNKQICQHTRLSSLFSNNGGKNWYDIDIKKTWIDRLLKRWYPVKFPYMP